MVDHRRTGPIAWAALAATLIGAGAVRAADEGPTTLASATGRGAFNVGASRASVATVEGPAELGRVVRLDYVLPAGTAAGVWAKGFSGGLDASRVDVVEVGARSVGGGKEAGAVAATLEIKGSNGLERIPIGVEADWGDRAEHRLDWGRIGVLSEVVVSVVPSGGSASGSVDLDVRFGKVGIGRKLAGSPAVRLGAAGLLALIVALVVKVVPGTARSGGFGGFGGDLARGLGAVGVAGLAAATFDLGARGGWDAGWGFLIVALMGAIVADWWRIAATGRHLTSAEAGRHALATGLLAASSGPVAILQAPGAWSDLIVLSQSAAAVAVLIYHAANARALVARGESLGPVAGGMIVGTPYLFGGLVLLGSAPLVRELGDWLSLENLADHPAVAEALGRILALFLFNEAVALALGLATKGRAVRSVRAHLAMLAVAALAVLAGPVADYGSGAEVADWPRWARPFAVVLATVLSQGGLWAEVYLFTGLLLDATAGVAPSRESTARHPLQGMVKGIVYSGVFMTMIQVVGALASVGAVRWLADSAPVLLAVPFGALAFPMVKTIFETFDGSQGFFRRAARAYGRPSLYLRGAVVGLGVGVALMMDLSKWGIIARATFGLIVGALASAGVDGGVDRFEASKGRAKVRPARSYLVMGLLGGSIGAAIGFYLDAAQVEVILDKFHRYLEIGARAVPFDDRLLLSEWGFFDLGPTNGGVKLLFDEALAGVITWAVPAWLFAINRTFLAAYFRRDPAPIRTLFTPEGRSELIRNMIEVLRWGLWMSPIIKSFLRMTGDPSWYNQDGAIRTLWATYQDLTLSPGDFRAWSLHVFTMLLAYDSIRILIWLDHFGLRVATLVNLSFLGMDRLDEKLARFLRPESTARCIPEGVKRFTTWAPLLLPFYIPRDADWTRAWAESGAGRPKEVSITGPLLALPIAGKLAWMGGLIFAGTAAFSANRTLGRRTSRPSWTLANREYEVELKPTGEIIGRSTRRGFDLTRRSYDGLDPAGRALFAVDGSTAWPIVGNFPGVDSIYGKVGDAITIEAARAGARATVAITLPDADVAAELWTITLENTGDAPRRLDLVPYGEWVLNRPDADRGHTQYNRLFAEMEYAPGLNAVMAWDKHAKAMGVLAADVAPEGFLTSRADFIGRARSLRSPSILETMAFTPPEATDAHPTFDPIAALCLGIEILPGESKTVRLLFALADGKAEAVSLVARHLGIVGASEVSTDRKRKEFHAIGHGAIPPGTPQPYSEFSDDGRTLRVLTPFTTRPYDHAMSNALGHVVALTNRGFQTTSSGNAQQNRITPDWPDTVTREAPPEAFYLYEPDSGEWFSPTYHPLNDPEARHEVEFGVDGTAIYRMNKGSIAAELTVFVPPDEPVGVYLLTVRNRSDRDRLIRLGTYFQIVLAAQPEHAGPLRVRADVPASFVTFENPRNNFRGGPAFVLVDGFDEMPEIVTTRGRFFGPGRDAARPDLLANASPSDDCEDDRPVAAIVGDLRLSANGEQTIVVLLGQADDIARARAVARKLGNGDAARSALARTQSWWLGLMDAVRVRSASPEFDRYLDWLKYQALAERIWARRGFYQASGAFGFRDQLQDSVNLIGMDPSIARKQILLHASQQFLEGDVVHWFHRLQDGRTGFAARTHASDNLLWLAWAAVEYVGATGDSTLLDERRTYLESELPFEPLPAGKHGMGFDPLRSSRDDSVYRHCLRSIDLVLDHRMGAHGLPLIGTGDWNDGLDEIGSQGRGESVWLGFFLYYILERMAGIVEAREGPERRDHYLGHLGRLGEALEGTWRGDRYLRAIHDDGTEIGVAGSGVWEIDALTAAWAVMAGINPVRGRVVFETALSILEKDTTILLGWPPLREDTKPYLGRSSWYPEGVRENGMYCHGVQWLVGAARVLSDRAAQDGKADEARHHAESAYRLWLKISAIPHVAPDQIETYGGQPNKQAADMVTTFDPGRMIWHGYTGAAGWMFRQAIEGVLGLRLVDGSLTRPPESALAAELGAVEVDRDVSTSPLADPTASKSPSQHLAFEPETHPT